ncbi:hypothetical protein BGZ98_004334 [Dissophora globulifera]|nr:hypothetical protein BGZ98_004334 [Dissophora globulifera]
MSKTTDMPTSKEDWIPAADGHEIFTKTWFALGPAVASIVFVHGLGEHVVRYDHVFKEFNKAGFQVSGFDQRGFGQTGNAIVLATCTIVLADNVQIVSFVMGGSLVLNYDCIGPLRTQLAGLIASAPLVLASAPTRPNGLTLGFAGLVSRVLPSLQLPIKLSSVSISRDKEEVAKYDADPLVHGYGTTLGLYDMLKNGEALLTERYKDITPDVPLLICHGTDDGLTDQKASKQFFDKVQVKDKEYKVYEGHYHELHNEPEPDRKVVIDYYIQWIRKHLPGNA